MLSEGIIIAVLTVVASGMASFYTVRSGRKKQNADAAAVVTDAAVALVEPLKKEIAEVRDENCGLEGELRAIKNQQKHDAKRVTELSAEVAQLRIQVQDKDGKILQLEASIRERDQQIAQLQADGRLKDGEIAELRGRVDELERGVRHE